MQRHLVLLQIQEYMMIGLVHISEMSEKFVKDPKDIVKVGDIVKVKVIEKDLDRQKVKLSMKI